MAQRQAATKPYRGLRGYMRIQFGEAPAGGGIIEPGTAEDVNGLIYFDFKGLVLWRKMYIHASQIVYRAFKRRVFSAEIAKSIHSHLRKCWERLGINDKPRRGDTGFILSIG